MKGNREGERIEVREKGKGMSIANRVSLIVISLSLLIFIVTGFIINNRITNIVTNMVKEELSLEAENAAYQVDSFLNKKSEIVVGMANNEFLNEFMKELVGVTERSKAFETKNFDGLSKTFANIKKSDSDLLFVYAALRDNNNVISEDPEFRLPDDFDLNTRDWFSEPLKTGKRIITSPYIDINGNLILSISHPLFDEDEPIGVAVVDLTINKLSEVLSGISVTEGTETFLLEKDGTYVYHPDNEKILNNKITDESGDILAVGNEMIEGKTGSNYIEMEDGAKYIGYSNVPTSDWSIAITVPEDYVSKKVRNVRVIFLILYSISCIVLGLTVYIITKKAFKPLAYIQSAMDKISNYNLDTEDERKKLAKYINKNDEVGEITRSIRRMVSNLKVIVENISQHATNTAATAQQLTATAQSTNESSGEVASAVENIAEGATSQSHDTASAANNIEENTNLLNDMLAMLQELKELTDDIDGKKDEGKVALEDLDKLTDINKEESVFISEIILETNESAEAISKASEMIQSIADQTNLLALNAAIDFAHAL